MIAAAVVTGLLAGSAAAAPKPPASKAELARLADEGMVTSAVTTGEKMHCLSIWNALKAWVPEFGGLDLPSDFTVDLPQRVKAWEKVTRKAYKENGDGGFSQDLTARTAEVREKLDSNDLRWVASYGGSCRKLPKD
jgi:hypothetical protein